MTGKPRHNFGRIVIVSAGQKFILTIESSEKEKLAQPNDTRDRNRQTQLSKTAASEIRVPELVPDIKHGPSQVADLKRQGKGQDNTSSPGKTSHSLERQKRKTHQKQSRSSHFNILGRTCEVDGPITEHSIKSAF